MEKYNLTEGNEALNRVLLMMKYDSKKTLTENKEVLLLEQVTGDDKKSKKIVFSKNSASQENPNYSDITKDVGLSLASPSLVVIPKNDDSGQTKKTGKVANIYPIPGYTAYNTPKPDTVKGGINYMYFPDDANMTFWVLALPEHLSQNLIHEKKLGDKLGRPVITAEHLYKILPPGTVRQFITKDGELFNTHLKFSKKDANLTVFKGYFSEKTNKPYVSPNPEDYKDWFEKQADKVGLWTQVIVSIVVSIIVSYFTMGMGLSLVMRIFWEVMAESVINAPFIYRDIKRKDNWQAGLSIVFCLLPYMDAKLLSKIGPLGKFGQPEMTAAKELAEELAAATNDGKSILDFYNSIPVDGVKRYLFSRVIQQSPELLEENVKIAVKQFLNDKTSKKALVKIMGKDRNWWKSGGMQLSTAIGLTWLVSSNTDTFNESEIKRLSNLIAQAISKIEKNGVKIKYDELMEAIRVMTPEQRNEYDLLNSVEDVELMFMKLNDEAEKEENEFNKEMEQISKKK